MTKRYFILIFIAFSLQGYSQEKELDSIKNVLENYKERDTTKVNLLNEITPYYLFRDISKNEPLLKEAIAISKELNFTRGLVRSYSTMASVQLNIGNYDKSLEYVFKAKKIQDSIKDIHGLIVTNISIARVYIHLGKPKKAVKIQLENLALLKEQPDENTKAQIHFYLASAYSQLEDYNNAEINYKATKKIAEKTNFKTGIAIANSSLGIVESKRKNYKAAIGYLKNALQFYKSNNQEANIAHTNLELGVVFAKMGQVNNAINAADKAIVTYKKQNGLKNLKRAYFEQKNYYKLKNDYLNSNKYLEAYYSVKDSLFTKEKTLIIEEMQTKYETEKALNDKKDAEQETEIIKLQNQKNTVLFLSLLGICVLLLLTSLFYYGKLKIKKKAQLIAIELKETQKRLAIEKQFRNSELKAIKAQMNPHFIFNAINSIQDLVLQKNTLDSYDYLVSFSKLVRNTLDFSEKGFISIKEEIDYLNVYLSLEQLRFKNDFSFTLINEIKNESRVPPLILQPFVENAIKHGLFHQTKEKKLEISFSRFDDYNLCTITDNGVGRKKSSEIQKRQGIGHQSFSTDAIKRRLTILSEQMNQKCYYETIDLTNKNDEAIGTKVLIYLPTKITS